MVSHSRGSHPGLACCFGGVMLEGMAILCDMSNLRGAAWGPRRYVRRIRRASLIALWPGCRTGRWNNLSETIKARLPRMVLKSGRAAGGIIHDAAKPADIEHNEVLDGPIDKR